MDPRGPKKMKLTAECSTSSTTGPSTSNVANSVTLKPKLRVLSLFDRIGFGLIALEKLGLDIEVYFACEINADALKVTSSNFGIKINQLGSVRDIDESKLDELGEINLLIGGSPSKDLSLNHRGRGIFDTDGTGPLFFEYYRIWNILKQKNNLFYWLYENVFDMADVYKSVISKFLESDYVIIDSLAVVSQKEKRLFWSNLPFLRELEVQLREVDANSSPQLGMISNPVDDENLFISIMKIETVFGLPLHFTDKADLNAKRRLELLGKSWSIPIMALIFRPLTEIFRLRENNK